MLAAKIGLSLIFEQLLYDLQNITNSEKQLVLFMTLKQCHFLLEQKWHKFVC